MPAPALEWGGGALRRSMVSAPCSYAGQETMAYTRRSGFARRSEVPEFHSIVGRDAEPEWGRWNGSP